MRILPLGFTALAFLAPDIANAQQGIEHQDLVWGFSINFPHQPDEENIPYTNFYGDTIPARIFRGASEQWDGQYALTAVSYSSYPADSHTAIEHAAQTFSNPCRYSTRMAKASYLITTIDAEASVRCAAERPVTAALPRRISELLGYRGG